MKCGRIHLVCLALLLAAAAPPVHAASMFGAEVFGAFNTHSMGDWNDAIQDANDAGFDFEEVNSSFGGGLGLRFWPNSNFMISGVWEPLFITREDDASGTELNLDGNSVQGTLAYFFPSAGGTRFGLGAGVGYYMLAGEGSLLGATEEIEGNAIGFHALGLGEFTVSPGFAITAGAGYRVANIEETEVGGVETGGETDYSGFTARLGLAFYFPTGDSGY